MLEFTTVDEKLNREWNRLAMWKSAEKPHNTVYCRDDNVYAIHDSSLMGGKYACIIDIREIRRTNPKMRYWI